MAYFKRKHKGEALLTISIHSGQSLLQTLYTVWHSHAGLSRSADNFTERFSSKKQVSLTFTKNVHL